LGGGFELIIVEEIEVENLRQGKGRGGNVPSSQLDAKREKGWPDKEGGA